MKETRRRDEVRNGVRELLARSASFEKLKPEERREITRSTIAVAEAMAGDSLAQADFPEFVRDLLHGVFEGVVDASIQQMEAYAELLKEVTKTIDDFTTCSVSDEAVFEYLRERGLDPGCEHWAQSVRGLLRRAARAQIAAPRQELLASMVLIGISRIVEADSARESQC